ncbi:WYL domain-containing protein [Flavobacterium cheonhonense]|uniref:WYL domain-containing protein n=1 Tax=Flavobacterium cheonhonense TaxID=706185 RepID=A0ABP7THY5_9FLAO|nr:WYL domain-containing protein [Flavobacterium cheonhonense]
MAINKLPFGRYHVIDSLLSKGERVKTSEIQRAILYELQIKVSSKTINNDLNDMRDSKALGYFAPIEKDLSKKAYYYSDPDYTIKAFGLKDADINALQFYANTINQYKDYEVFKDFATAIEKILAVLAGSKGAPGIQKTRSIVQTERTPLITGGHLIPKIVEAINTKYVIAFKYQKFDDEKVKEVKLQPYLLKEDRHLWYVLGKNHKGHLITYALDRIKDFTISNDKFLPDDFDFEDYFKYSFGITVTDEVPVNTVLSFTPFQGKYIKALPIHPTQKILLDNDQELRISVEVKPAYEFYEKILGYGANVRVISPPEIVSDLKERLKQALNLYK